MAFFITKASGESELFNEEKFRYSLAKAGASNQLINQIAAQIEKKTDLRTTTDIYRFALRELNKHNTPVAARYNIKQALLELGPAGFPFEQFIGKLFQEMGYTIKTGQIITGKCVTHEVDVVAHKDNELIMIECKFRNRPNLRCDVKVTLYIKARFDDIAQALANSPNHQPFNKAYIVTNTKFTSQALAYAQCSNINLLGGTYPQDNSLFDLVKKFQLYPITTLTFLTRPQKTFLIQGGLILCRDARNYETLIHSLGFSQKKTEEFIRVCESVGKIPLGDN